MRTVALLVLAALPGCRVEWGAEPGAARSSAESGPVLVYTSMYRPVVEALTAAMKEDLPDIQPQWFQAGSEKVAARLDAELRAGACPADILATSDPAHFARLKQERALRIHVPPGVLRMPPVLADPDGAYFTMRLATMVLAWRDDEKSPPARMADLWSPAFRDQAIVGDPLTSGTFFTSLAILERVHGPAFFPGLRAAGVVATGGNSAVQEKVLAREKRAGLLLLENVLMAREAGQPLSWRLPEDGVVVVPGPVGILASAPHPRTAERVEDWFMAERAQRIIVDVGRMHAARTSLAPPPGAPPLAELLEKAMELSPATWEALRDEGAQVKARFSAAYGR